MRTTSVLLCLVAFLFTGLFAQQPCAKVHEKLPCRLLSHCSFVDGECREEEVGTAVAIPSEDAPERRRLWRGVRGQDTANDDHLVPANRIRYDSTNDDFGHEGIGRIPTHGGDGYNYWLLHNADGWGEPLRAWELKTNEALTFEQSARSSGLIAALAGYAVQGFDANYPNIQPDLARLSRVARVLNHVGNVLEFAACAKKTLEWWSSYNGVSGVKCLSCAICFASAVIGAGVPGLGSVVAGAFGDWMEKKIVLWLKNKGWKVQGRHASALHWNPSPTPQPYRPQRGRWGAFWHPQ